MQPAAAAPGANPPQQQQQRGGWGGWSGFIWRLFLIYLVTQFLFGGRKPAATPTLDATGKPESHYNLFNRGEPMDLLVYLSHTEEEVNINQDKLLWYQKDISLDSSDGNYRTEEIVLPVTEHLHNNGSLYAHVFLVKKNHTLTEEISQPSKLNFIHAVHKLNVHKPRAKFVDKLNLISGEFVVPPEQAALLKQQEIVSYWKPNLTVSLIDEFSGYSKGQIPPQLKSHYKFGKDGFGYYPIIFFNDFWMLSETYILINESVTELPLTVSFEPLSHWKWMLMLQMEESFAMQKTLGAENTEIDEFKRMLIDTNPYLLGLTMVVSILHMIFDFLSFKNDISHWRQKESMKATSVRSIFLSVICQTIIFLYLLDNDTSFLILISIGVGLLIEVWKLNKAVIISLQWVYGIPLPKFTSRESYASETEQYDKQAFKYLSWILFPLVVGYSIYNLYFESHKSWYSWLLSSLTGCVYTFGFIMMTPQLFLNYKHKSVAHLPWRALIYRALNTFIDDLFAFIIKMPTLHRLSVFRDDLIFFIYLYQRWAYRVDKTRSDGYGVAVEEPPAGSDSQETPTAEGALPPTETKKDK